MEVSDQEKKGTGVGVEIFWNMVEEKCAIYLTE